MRARARYIRQPTMPEFDVEEERLKLELWLRLIWNGVDPVAWLWLTGS